MVRTFKVLPAFLPVILPMLQGAQMLFQSLERAAPFPDPTGPVLDTKRSSCKFVQWVNRWINRPLVPKELQHTHHGARDVLGMLFCHKNRNVTI